MSRPAIERLEDWTYKVEGVADPLPSVTTIIQKTVPKELAWWGMTVGCAGAAQILNEGIGGLSWVGSPGDKEFTLQSRMTGEWFVAQLNQRKLTVNHTLSKAGDRGSAIHDMLEEYGKTGAISRLDDIDLRYSGYARGLVQWIMENRPRFIKQETMTASPKYGYAGTYDVRCVLEDGKHKGKLALVDLKTSKQIYKDQYFPQVEAYEQAEIELGEDPTDIRLVVLVMSDGKYKQAVSTDSFADFEVLLNHWHSIQRRKRKKK